MDAAANDSLSIMWFLGLAVGEPAPDHRSEVTSDSDRSLLRGAALS